MIYVGYAAALLVLLTFCMKQMIPLRVVALFSNVAFLAYACGMQLLPVILLHGVLIPIKYLQAGLGHSGTAPFTRRSSVSCHFSRAIDVAAVSGSPTITRSGDALFGKSV